MLSVDIPGHRELHLHHLVADYNGTLAVDGRLLFGLADLLTRVAKLLEVHVVTADTFGLAARELAGLPLTLTVLPAGGQAEAKAEYLRQLGAETGVALGNGRNDRWLLREAALGIGVIQAEGASLAALAEADVVCRSAHEALQLLLDPRRLIATLRS